MSEKNSKEVTKVPKSAKIRIELNTTDKRQETIEKFQQLRKEMNENFNENETNDGNVNIINDSRDDNGNRHSTSESTNDEHVTSSNSVEHKRSKKDNSSSSRQYS